MIGRTTIKIIILLGLITGLAGCGVESALPHLKPLPADALARLAEKGMGEQSPIFIRVFKKESELEVWKQKEDGRFYYFKTYPICNWSGKLGPKLFQGDKQAPEGFYHVAKWQMNPKSKFHLSFNLGYPNTYDRAHNRTGAHLMIHGDCKSAGCYAMTDALMEEIYNLAREAFKGGQKTIPVYAYPFRMTDENMKLHRKSKWYGFWRTLKQGYDAFEVSRIPAKVYVCDKRYLINVNFVHGVPGGKLDAKAACPIYQKLPPDLFLGEPTLDLVKSNKKPFPNPFQSGSFGLTSKPGSLRDLAVRESMRVSQ